MLCTCDSLSTRPLSREFPILHFPYGPFLILFLLILVCVSLMRSIIGWVYIFLDPTSGVSERDKLPGTSREGSLGPTVAILKPIHNPLLVVQDTSFNRCESMESGDRLESSGTRSGITRPMELHYLKVTIFILMDIYYCEGA